MFVCTSYVYMCAIFAWGNVLTFGTIHDLQSTLKGFLTPTQVGGWVSWVRDRAPLRVKCEVWVCQMCTFLSQIERGTISDPGDLFQPPSRTSLLTSKAHVRLLIFFQPPLICMPTQFMNVPLLNGIAMQKSKTIKRLQCILTTTNRYLRSPFCALFIICATCMYNNCITTMMFQTKNYVLCLRFNFEYLFF